MPRWLNILWSVFILGAFGFGIYSFAYTQFDNLKAFVAPGIALLAYIVHLAVNTFFANADLAATMLVSLLFLGIALIISSVFIAESKSGYRLYEIGLAIVGLALGIPFGEKLRASERRTVAKRKKQTASEALGARTENDGTK